MILVTVGTQGPFDRLVRAVDDWLREHPDVRAFGQIGRTNYRPKYMEASADLDPEDFERRVAVADIVVAHAGMGTILTALEAAKPILIMPRRAALGEHRNDHQVATARRLAGRAGIVVAEDEHELRNMLQERRFVCPEAISTTASTQLLEGLRLFIGRAPRRRR